MGDQTFTAEDVIRIYAFYLDLEEQKTVEEFFETFEEREEFTFVEDLLNILDRLFSIFSSARFGALAVTFGVATNLLLVESLRQLRRGRTALSSILDQGGVDA